MSTTDHTATDQARPDGTPPQNRLRAQRQGLRWWQALAAASRYGYLTAAVAARVPRRPGGRESPAHFGRD